MYAPNSKYTNGSGTFPNWTAIDVSGAGLTDGTEYKALCINDGWEGVSQAIMDYASGNANAPTGTAGTPNSVTEAAGVSQIIQALQIAHGIGPGMYVQRAIEDAPGTYGDRILILAEQGVLVASYPDLVAATYCGDGSNTARHAAGGKFYKSSDAAGTTPNIAGPYFQLPAQPDPKFLKQYVAGNTYNGVALTVTGSNWTTTRGVFVPYKTADGTYRLIINIYGSISSGTNNGFTISIIGITFRTGTRQATALYDNTMATRAADEFGTAIADGGTSNIQSTFSSSISLVTSWGLFVDAELDSAPTWMEDFDIEWGITY